MMTALAFIIGCVPLWVASGAGSVARQIIGTTVIGGMLAETFIGRFFVPAIFVLVEKLSPTARIARSAGPEPLPSPAQGD
jgi:HAE1 family hydrophobic/amphiphilic exporter-1